MLRGAERRPPSDDEKMATGIQSGRQVIMARNTEKTLDR
jgi:hypothetical protein